MAAELSTALDELATIVGSVTDLNAEPSDPPSDYTAFPFYVIEPDSGVIQKDGSMNVTALHTVSIQIHAGLPSTITPRDRSHVTPFLDLVKDKIFIDANATANSSVDTVAIEDDPMTYTWGLIGYRGIPTIGYEITLTVKIRSAESGGAYAKG